MTLRLIGAGLGRTGTMSLKLAYEQLTGERCYHMSEVFNGDNHVRTWRAAANGDNSVGVSGIGWNLSHRMMRVSNQSTGSAAVSTLQHAARTSIEAGDNIASVSYSGADTNSKRNA